MSDKATLRKDATALRNQLDAIYGKQAAAEAAEHALSYFKLLKRETVIALYLPIKSELDTCFIANDLALKGYALALPVVGGSDDPLTFRRWAPGDPLEEGSFGTKHPEEPAPEVTPDVVLLPVLAFTKSGYRLGYGGGFYDRTLVKLTATKAIGFAYMGQMIDEMPVDPHDMSMEAVITETGIVMCGD